MSDNINNRLPNDMLGDAIQVANTFRTYDDATVAVKSPITLLTATNQLITVPINAPVIIIHSNQNLKVGIAQTDVEGTGNGYTIIPMDLLITKGVAGLNSFYLRNDSGSTATIYFEFSIL